MVFALSLLLLVKAEVEHTEPKSNKELKKEVIKEANAYKYYKFKVDDGFKGDRDITIKTSLTEEHPWSNPDIYLAKDSTQPNSTHFQIGE